MSEIEISFIIPARNEEDYIAETLESIDRQDIDREKEVIVVDGGSSDSTQEIARKHGARVIEDIRGRGVARHKGAVEAEGEYLAFVDADTELEPEYAEDMISFLEENECVAASCKYNMTGVRSKVIQAFGNLAFPKRNPALLPGFNIVVKRDAYLESEGFEHSYAEDLKFSDEIAEHGETGFLDKKLVSNSGRRVALMGLSGVLVYYGGKYLLDRIGKKPSSSS